MMYALNAGLVEIAFVGENRACIVSKLADGSLSAHPLVTNPQPDPLVYDGPWGSATPFRDALFGPVRTYRCGADHAFSFRAKNPATYQWCWADDGCEQVARLQP